MEQVLALGVALRRYRLAAGISQEALAEHAGLSVEGIGAIERGQRRPRPATLRALGAALGLSPLQIGELALALRRTGRSRTAPPPPALPAQSTPLIGRTHELAVVAYLLRIAGVRLLTLSGVGGVGKTRVAVQAAIEAAGAFPDGVVWVDLAPLRDPSLVEAALAQQVGLGDEGSAPLRARLLAALRTKRVLVLLDNFEHVLVARDLVRELLAACPGISVLVTSRACLTLESEQEYPLAPLALPDPSERSVEAVAKASAVALFLQQAQAALPTMRLTETTAPLVAEICRRLDGLPLAIELAAALVRVLPPQEMIAQLGDGSAPGSPGSRPNAPPRLDVLERGGWGLPDRQQSMRRCTAWSYDLLAPEEQRVFRHLGVLIGGWDEAAAAAVAGDAEDGALPIVLARLAAKHLIRREGGPGGTPRFSMLETIREYASERLVASGAADAVHERHAAHYLNLAEQARSHLRGAEEDSWLARLEQEHGNLRAALSWDAAAAATAAQGARLAGALWLFWQIRGFRREGLAWLEHMLDLAADAPAAWRARALHGAGILRYDLGDYTGARPLLAQALALREAIPDIQGVAESLHGLGCVAQNLGEYAQSAALFVESLALRQQRGDRRGAADSLSCLGNLAWEQGDYERARQLHEEALAMLRAVGNRRGIATALGNLGLVAQTTGDLARARRLYEQGLAIHRAMGDKEGIARGVHNVGDVALEQGDHGAASRLLEEAVHLWRDVGHSLGQAYSLNSLGGLALLQGDRARAAARYRESLVIGREIGHKRSVADALEWLAVVLSLWCEACDATRLFGAAAALRDAEGAARWPQAQQQYEGAVKAARAALGESAFDAVWAEGAAMTFEQAIARALGQPSLVSH